MFTIFSTVVTNVLVVVDSIFNGDGVEPTTLSSSLLGCSRSIIDVLVLWTEISLCSTVDRTISFIAGILTREDEIEDYSWFSSVVIQLYN
jgi:hypothetical protein